MQKLTIGRIALTGMAAFAVVYTVWGVFKTGGLMPALMLIPLMALLLPQARDKIQQKLRVWPGTGWSIGVAVFLMLLQMGMFGDAQIAARDAEQARLQKESAERVAKVKQDRLDDYNKNKQSILSEISRLTDAGQLQEAVQLAAKYLTVTKDPDLGRLQYRADLALMRQEAAKPKELTLARRLQVFETLSKEEPSNASYVAGAKEARELIEIQKKVEAATKNRQALEASVKGQFSGIDGSHRNVEAELKARLRDPGSYEHVETRYLVGAESITVYTRYRAKNGFGGLNVSTAVAEVDGSGRVLSLRTE